MNLPFCEDFIFAKFRENKTLAKNFEFTVFLVALWSPAGKGLASYLSCILYVMFSCDLVTFLYGVLGQVWYLVVSISDPCRLPFFDLKKAPKLSQQFVSVLDIVMLQTDELRMFPRAELWPWLD